MLSVNTDFKGLVLGQQLAGPEKLTTIASHIAADSDY